MQSSANKEITGHANLKSYQQAQSTCFRLYLQVFLLNFHSFWSTVDCKKRIYDLFDLCFRRRDCVIPKQNYFKTTTSKRRHVLLSKNTRFFFSKNKQGWRKTL